ncbi:MAG: DUF2155 domain-containing protein [Pseudomonadota bacterium]
MMRVLATAALAAVMAILPLPEVAAQVETSPLAPPAAGDEIGGPPVPTPRGGVRVRDGTGRVIEDGASRRVAVPPPPEDDIVIPGVGPVDGQDPTAIGSRLPNGTAPRITIEEGTALPRDWQSVLEDERRRDTAEREARFRDAPFRTDIERVYGDISRAIELGETRSAEGGEITVLDMITGATETITMPAGGEAQVGRLVLRLLACEMPGEAGDVGDVGLVQIWDRRQGGTEESAPAFSGWMFAESPALSALDHPRYDVWLRSCTTAEG